MNNPFVLEEKGNIAIIDGRASSSIVNNLKKRNLEVILTCKCEELYDSISYHPDIVIHPINYNTLMIAPNVFEYYEDIFSYKGFKLIKGEKKLLRNYPDNIAYNVARVSKYAIHNIRYTDEKLKFYLEKEGISFINVKQGYSKCSTAIINNNAIITSDVSIYKESKKYNIDVCLIKQGFIELPGLNYGFIGGATGMLSQYEVLFTGNYEEHESKKAIDNFLKKYRLKPIFLSEDKIIDVGSIITLKYN
ncbi:DUF6873 family GME fold protein [Gottschalkia purinilytica]|nr:hypothetical protein [Gottschalkia purinilytica]